MRKGEKNRKISVNGFARGPGLGQKTPPKVALCGQLANPVTDIFGFFPDFTRFSRFFPVSGVSLPIF